MRSTSRRPDLVSCWHMAYDTASWSAVGTITALADHSRQVSVVVLWPDSRDRLGGGGEGGGGRLSHNGRGTGRSATSTSPTVRPRLNYPPPLRCHVLLTQPQLRPEVCEYNAVSTGASRGHDSSQRTVSGQSADSPRTVSGQPADSRTSAIY